MDPRTMRKAATHSLSVAPYSPRKLALIHTGVMVLVSMLLSVISFFLSRNIDSSTGLQGMDSRVAIGSFLSFLRLSSTILMPFWEIGFLYTALRFAHTQDAEPTDLLQGFRRFGPVLRLTLLQLGLVLAVSMLCSFIGSTLFSFTPFMQDAAARIEAMPELNTETASTFELLRLIPEMRYMMVIFVIALLVIGLPMFYKFRLSNYVIMDDTRKAMVALRTSTRLTMGRRMKLFKLDLHFWWYYLAYVLVAVVSYGDTLLSALGIALPVNPDVLFFGFLGISALMQLFLAWRFGAMVQTTYAHFYFHLKLNPAVAEPMTPTQPTNPRN